MVALLLFVIAVTAGGETIYFITFDNARLDYSEEAGVEPRFHEIGIYVPGNDEIIAPQTNRVLIKYFEPRRQTDADRPLLLNSEQVLEGSSQGGKALVLHSGRKAQGLLFDLTESLSPGDLTIEWIAMFRDIEPEGNVYQLTYLGSNEWPFGGAFQWAIRRAPDQPLNFTVFKTGGGEIRLSVRNHPIESMRWYHFAGVLDFNEADPADSMLRFYLDGELQAESVYDASLDVWSLGGSNSRYEPAFAIGYSQGQDANPYDSRGLSGAIDAFAVSSAALKPGEFVIGGKN